MDSDNRNMRNTKPNLLLNPKKNMVRVSLSRESGCALVCVHNPDRLFMKQVKNGKV